MSLFFASGGQSIGVSASASALPMNIQDRFPLGGKGTEQELEKIQISVAYLWFMALLSISMAIADIINHGSSSYRADTQTFPHRQSFPIDQRWNVSGEAICCLNLDFFNK